MAELCFFRQGDFKLISERERTVIRLLRMDPKLWLKMELVEAVVCPWTSAGKIAYLSAFEKYNIYWIFMECELDPQMSIAKYSEPV